MDYTVFGQQVRNMRMFMVFEMSGEAGNTKANCKAQAGLQLWLCKTDNYKRKIVVNQFSTMDTKTYKGCGRW